MPSAPLREEIRSILGWRAPARRAAAEIHDAVRLGGYTRKALSFQVDDGEAVEAFLFEPAAAPRPVAVVALHQHASQWALGKSEVAGLRGDPHQAFGPALARAGVTVLAPDAIGFESRCAPAGAGASMAPAITRPHGSAEGWLQYYNHAMHRLVQGRLLMADLLHDVAAAVGVVEELSGAARVGVVGHSHGGNVALFAAALDPRVAFACASGAVCSYRHKLAHGTGLDMALVIPSFAARHDFDDLLRCVAPRRLLVVSSDADPYSADAGEVVARARPAFAAAGCEGHLEQLHFAGPHALDAERFGAIVEWITRQA